MNLYSSMVCVESYNKECSLCISNNGNIFSFGYNPFSKNKENLNPTEYKDLTDIKMISCGVSHISFIDYNDNIFYFNRDHELNIPQQVNLPPCKQVSCADYFAICVSHEGNIYSIKYEKDITITTISSISNVDFVECGSSFVICKTFNNEFYSWGDNYYGQLGQGHSKDCKNPSICENWPDNIISIKSGDSHSLLLTLDGQVYSFGSNTNGQLGLNDEHLDNSNTPRLITDIPEIKRIECGHYYNLLIDIDDCLWVFGSSFYGQLGLGNKDKKRKPIKHPSLTDIIDISSGGGHVLVKTIDNKIYAFGHNNNSQLGIQTPNQCQLTPIQVLKGKEDIWCSTFGKSRAKSARK